MKKLSLALLMTLAGVQSIKANPGAFNGFYLGGNLGWTQRNDKTNLEAYDVTEGVPSFRTQQNELNKSHRANGINYGLYGGYGQNNNGFYWSVEFNVAHDTANKGNNSDNEDIKGDGVPVDDMHGRLYTKYERGVVFGLAPRIGAVIANENLIYVKLGMEYSHDKITYQWKLLDRGHPVEGHKGIEVSRKKQIVFVPGLGYERAFGKLLARVEYGYNFGAKIQSPPLMSQITVDTCHSRSTVKYASHILKFGIAYKF